MDILSIMDFLSSKRNKKTIIFVPKFFLNYGMGEIIETDIQARILNSNEEGTEIEIIDVSIPDDKEEESEPRDVFSAPRIVPSPS
jgi:hypothetical protein